VLSTTQFCLGQEYPYEESVASATLLDEFGAPVANPGPSNYVVRVKIDTIDAGSNVLLSVERDITISVGQTFGNSIQYPSFEFVDEGQGDCNPQRTEVVEIISVTPPLSTEGGCGTAFLEPTPEFPVVTTTTTSTTEACKEQNEVCTVSPDNCCEGLICDPDEPESITGTCIVELIEQTTTTTTTQTPPNGNCYQLENTIASNIDVKYTPVGGSETIVAVSGFSTAYICSTTIPVCDDEDPFICGGLTITDLETICGSDLDCTI
jgi:hypothetical protein